jgi:hypothetical protein
MVDWIIGILETIASPVFRWARARGEEKRRRLHVFVLKAMGRTDLVVAPDIIGHRFDLFSIDPNLRPAQQHEALGGNDAIDDMVLFGQELDRKEYRRVFKKQAKAGTAGYR